MCFVFKLFSCLRKTLSKNTQVDNALITSHDSCFFLSLFLLNTLSPSHCVTVALSGCVTAEKCGSCPLIHTLLSANSRHVGQTGRRYITYSSVGSQQQLKKKKKNITSTSSVDAICNNKPVLEASGGNTVARRAHVMGWDAFDRAADCVIALILKGLSKCHFDSAARHFLLCPG